MNGNKVLIITDLEGISGIKEISQVSDTGAESYSYSLERLMADTNAAIAGAFDAGAEGVFVWDGHGTGKNFIPGALDPRAVQVPVTMRDIPLNEISAFMHVGSHAMSGTIYAFLDHTQSSATIHDYLYNNIRFGELEQCALFGGAYGIPLCAVCGDEAACAEGREFFGSIATAAVKKARYRNVAECIDPDEAVKLIYKTAGEGFRLRKEIKPFTITYPFEIKIVFNRSDYCDSACTSRPAAERLDARTVRVIREGIREYYDVLL